MKSYPASPRTRFTIPSLPATSAPVILSGPLFPARAARRTKFTLPALVFFVGAAFFASSQSGQAANTADPVLAGATDLGVNTAGTTYTTVATTTSDVEFLTATTYNSTLGLSAALSIGTLDDFNTSAIAINGTGLLTLNTAANSVAPNAADLLYVASGGSLSIQTSGGITFTPSGNVDDAGTLSLGTSPITITTSTTLSFLGAGTTTVGGNIAATTGAVAINNSGGSVTFSGTNAYTGATNIYNGALLSADVTSSLGNGSTITLNPGATLRTLSTSGGILGSGAIALNTSTIQVGNGTVANPSATLSGALALQGGNSTINLQDTGSGTATLKFTSTTTPSRSNGATLIVNAATALDGATDVLNFGPMAGGNAAAPNVITNGIFPGYELGTVGSTANAGFLTTTSGMVGANVKLFTGYVTPGSTTLTGLSSSSVYDFAANTTYTNGTNAQQIYAVRFDGGTTLNLGANIFNIGGGNNSTGGIIFNGTGNSITGTAALNSGNTSGNGELEIYTAAGGTATISTSIASTSGGPLLTFFGGGTITLSGASITDTNGGPITVNGGNVILNLTTGISGNAGISTVVNGGTLTLGLANIFNGTSGYALTVNTLGTLDLHGNNEVVNNLSGGSSALVLGGTITSTTGSAVLTLNNASSTYYGSITSSGLGLTKLGNNTENLDGTLSYGGATTVNGGQLTFAPIVAGVNDSLGAVSFAQGLGTVQSNYQGTGTTTLTFSNLTARPAGAEANFITSGGTNGTSNKIVLTSVSGATPTAKTLLDPGYFFGGSAYATVDANGFLRGYTATDTNGVAVASGTSNIASNTASNVFVNGNQTAQATASVNTLNLTGSYSVTLASGATLSTNGVLSNGIAGIGGGTGLKTTTSGAELVLRSNANQLALTTPILDNGGTAVTTSGNIQFQAANTYTGATTVDSGTLSVGIGGAAGDLGSSSGVTLNSGGNLTFNRTTAYSFTNPITAGSFASGNTITQAGTGALTLGSITNSGNTNNLAVTRNASTGSLTLGTLNGNINLTDNSTTGSTSPTSVTQTGTGLTINQISGASGSVVNLGGTGTTGITSTLSSPGQTVNFNSGTINLNGNGGFQTTMVVNGATVNTLSSGSNGTNFYDILNLQVLSGTLNVQLYNGLRFGSNSGSNGTGGASSSASILSGGTINFTNGGNGGLNLGNSSTTAYTNTFTQSGGTINASAANNAVNIGAGTSGGGVSSYNFSGGTLLLNGTIAGAQGTGAEQSFVWTGGTLATSAYNATNLTSTQGTAVSATTNTLTNAGSGILAPGGVGTAGKTVITGNYAVSSPTTSSAALALDIGGANQATAFQNTAVNASYDLTTVSGTTALGGRLNVGLINGFTPAAQTFNVLTSTGAISGNFNNYQVAKSGAANVISAGGTGSFSVAVPNGIAGSVALSGFTANNTYTGNSTPWDAASAASWSVYDPGSSNAGLTTPTASGAVAQFGNGDTAAGAAAVSLNSTRNVAGILFNSTNAGATNYTINDAGNGTGVIVLDNTANGPAATITDSSATGNANAINVPITLNSPLAVSVTNATNTLTLGGVLSGAQPLTKTGLGTLVLTNANTYSGGTTISNNTGIIQITNTSALGTGTVALNAGGTSQGTLQLNFAGGTPAAPNVIANNITGASANTFTNAAPGFASLESVSGANKLTGTYTITTTGGTGQNIVTDAGSNLELAGTLSAGGITTGTRGFDFSGAGNTQVSGVISNGANATSGATVTVQVQKDGTGTLTLMNANTYTGTTLANAGTLLVNGSVGSAAAPAGVVTVNNNGTLGGTGMLTVASATVNTGGMLAPGATINATTGALTLSTTNGVTINGTLGIALGSTGNNGTVVTTSGGLNISGATLSLTGTPTVGGVYDLVNYTGTLTASGTNEGFATINGPAGYMYNVVAGTTFGGPDIELDVTSVPEPSTWLFGVLTTAAVGFQIRRRKARHH